MSRGAVEVAPDVLDVLALPDLDGLADAKVRGAECLWCPQQLTAETAVDFGVQHVPVDDTTSLSGMKWYPRACPDCTADRAHRGLFAHAPMCQLCRTKETAADCAVGRGLYRLVRDCRR
ncbi:hypothetical protein ACIREM_43570 [Streptomyces shenzhenensis]|uniref:hypothetical protein n=1 Tax=Streptomyces shenzhenensis TaxID=943815 RepID=UPI003809AC1A